MLKIARDAYRAIGAEGFARVDFLLRGDEIFLSEINTIPGFTPISLFPTMPAEAGYSFADVCLAVVDLAIERHAARAGGRLTPATCRDDGDAVTRAGAGVTNRTFRRAGGTAGGRPASGGHRPA